MSQLISILSKGYAMKVNLIVGVAASVLVLGNSSTWAAPINEVVAHDIGIEARSDLASINNNGSDRTIVGGTSTNSDFVRAMFYWSLSTVPANHVAITDGTATFTVYPHSSHAPADGKSVEVYRVKPSNAGWDETTATWNNFDQTVPTAWAGGPGLGDPDDGYDAAPFDTFTYTDPSSTITVTIPQAMLNDWIANPADNAGIIMSMLALDGTERPLRFWSNNGDVPAALSFETQFVPEPSGLLLVSLGIAGVAAVQRRRRRR
jgi:hypothetical protein